MFLFFCLEFRFLHLLALAGFVAHELFRPQLLIEQKKKVTGDGRLLIKESKINTGLSQLFLLLLLLAVLSSSTCYQSRPTYCRDSLSYCANYTISRAQFSTSGKHSSVSATPSVLSDWLPAWTGFTLLSVCLTVLPACLSVCLPTRLPAAAVGYLGCRS